jgi:trimethylamine:corrinoid methyltransferase-like protein
LFQPTNVEKVLTGMAQVLGGTNIIWGVGQLESQKGLSAVQAVIDDTVAGSLLRC